MNKVDFIGIGAGKAGSSYYYELLWEHPEVSMSLIKEVHYFNYLPSSRFSELPYNWAFEKSLDWYFSHWHKSDKYKAYGEFSTKYINDPKAAQKIKDTFPDVKLLVAVRNPVSRAYSHYLMYKNYYKKEERSFIETLKSDNMMQAQSMYGQNIKFWLEYFDKERILFNFLEDFKNDSRKNVRNLYNFIGVNPDYVPVSLNKPINEAANSRFIDNLDQYFVAFKRMCLKLGMQGALRWIRMNQLQNIPKNINYAKNTKELITEEEKAFAINFFKEDILLFQDLVDRDLSHWLVVSE